MRPALQRRQRYAPAWAGLSGLLLLTWLTRFLLLSKWPGEPDSAWFAIGAEQWRHFGAHAPQVYDRIFSPAYYWLAARAAAGTHNIAELSWRLNLISALAAVVSAWLAWEIGRRLTTGAAAFIAALFFVISPAVWWLGIEPHPQGPAIAFFLAALLCFLAAYPQPRWPQNTVAVFNRHLGWRIIYVGAALLALSASLLLRADGGMMLLVFPVLAARSMAAGRGAAIRYSQPFWLRLRHWLRESRIGWLLAAAASLIFLVGRSELLGASLLHSQDQSWREIAGYLGRLNWLKQALPMLTAPGLLTLPAVLGCCIYGWRRQGRAWVHHWLPLALSFSLPAYGFWFLVRGNNCRHVALYILVWLWPAAEAWAQIKRRHLAAGAAAILMLNLLLLPPSSNLTLAPSGNVFAAAQRLRMREIQVQRAASQWWRGAARRGGTACYLGAGTSPYVLWSLLQLTAGRLHLSGRSAGNLLALAPAAQVTGGRPLRLWFPGVYSPRGFQLYARTCANWFSLEYGPAGQRLYFFGNRLHTALKKRGAGWWRLWLANFHY